MFHRDWSSEWILTFVRKTNVLARCEAEPRAAAFKLVRHPSAGWDRVPQARAHTEKDPSMRWDDDSVWAPPHSTPDALSHRPRVGQRNVPPPFYSGMKEIVRTSMLSRGAASGGEVGSVKALWAVNWTRVGSLSNSLNASTSSGCMPGT